MIRVVSLFSGSLASIIATKLIQREEKIDELKLIHFRSPFFRDYDRTKQLTREIWENPDFRSQSVKKEFRKVANIHNGTYNLKSSCIGCRKLLIAKGLRYMERVKADFLITGEIVGVRGLGEMEMIEIVEAVGSGDRVLRPLSARLLPETLPERNGWVNHEHLKRLRYGEVDELRRLARELEIDVEGFSAEARCKLTQRNFGQRLEDLFQEKEFSMNALELLEFDLYYKKQPDVKIVLGRDDEEKRKLQTFFLPEDLRIYVPTYKGPMTLVRTNWQEKSGVEVEEIIKLAAEITASHADVKGYAKVRANYRFESKNETFGITVSPMPKEELAKYYLS
ncbi:MAG: hypothetical protein ACE5JP_01690 [Candidatus Bipolaricaulia bacterium]